MALYQCVQFSEEETHNSFFEQDTQVEKETKERCGTKPTIVPFRGTGKRESESLACKTNVVYHREGCCCAFSLNVLRQEDEVRLKFPGVIPRDSRHTIPAGPKLRSPGGVPREGPQSGEGMRRKNVRTYVFLQNASGSRVLRSGLVVYAKPEC